MKQSSWQLHGPAIPADMKTRNVLMDFARFAIIINVLALSTSFVYLCYGFTAIRNIFTLTVRE